MCFIINTTKHDLITGIYKKIMFLHTLHINIVHMYVCLLWNEYSNIKFCIRISEYSNIRLSPIYITCSLGKWLHIKHSQHFDLRLKSLIMIDHNHCSLYRHPNSRSIVGLMNVSSAHWSTLLGNRFDYLYTRSPFKVNCVRVTNNTLSDSAWIYLILFTGALYYSQKSFYWLSARPIYKKECVLKWVARVLQIMR